MAPFHIGPYRIDTPLALAPMVGVTDRCFRQLCRELGAGYLVTEMLASNPVLRETRTSRLRGDFAGEPEPVAVQLAGSEPDWMADAARYNADRGAAIIDINMGCPAKKVCNKLAGSALLSDPERVRAILEAVVGAVDVPVTLKIRTGPNRDQRNGVEIARMAADIGIAALAVHGRTRADRFRGEAEYETISRICEAVSIPVFANGDIDSPQQAAEVRRLTGAAGLMIGRAAQGNPWIFREIRHFLEHGHCPAPPPAAEVHAVMKRHLRHLHASYGESVGVRVARKHIGWYLQGRPGAGPCRDALMRTESAAGQFKLLAAYFASDAAAQAPGRQAA
ncbi:tRNA dihydrouridine synthase DusB [Wenzhouxiangellaceae bacterium CH-27]|uniref:tRNA-dihydrouridine synthase B n=1 Tax=Elongatibacter sediminis TaxID=3119006 RepID=A0AAW9RH48_9GAMM